MLDRGDWGNTATTHGDLPGHSLGLDFPAHLARPQVCCLGPSCPGHSLSWTSLGGVARMMSKPQAQ